MEQSRPQHMHPAQVLLEQSYSSADAATVFVEKVLRKPLRLRPTSPDPTSKDARSARRSQRIRREIHNDKRAKIKPLSAKEKRVTGVYDIPTHARKYETFESLHKMWICYMQEILGIVEGAQVFLTAQSKGPVLASADYHGAHVLVVRSRCASHVGLEGIVVKETKFTFQIITKENCIKIVPKKHTSFRFEIPQVSNPPKDESSATIDILPLVFELLGSQMEQRPAERATKKYKAKHLKDV